MIVRKGFIFLCLLAGLMACGVTGFAEETAEITEAVAAPFIYEDGGRRDPFWPLVNANGVIANYEKNFLFVDLVLEGVIAGDDDNNLAVINGQVLKEGDRLGDFLVHSITDNKVILYRGDSMFELKLKKEK